MGRRGLCSFHKPSLSSGATSRSGNVVGASEVLLHLPASVGAARGLPRVLQGAGQGWEHGLGWGRRECWWATREPGALCLADLTGAERMSRRGTPREEAEAQPLPIPDLHFGSDALEILCHGESQCASSRLARHCLSVLSWKVIRNRLK